MPKQIEDVIRSTLKGDTQQNALDLVAHLCASGQPIIMHDEKNESGWNAPDLGFILITGTDDFPGPWTMWLGAENLGENAPIPVDEHIKEFAWAHVSPCGSCGGKCTPGTRTTVFGKVFDNVCQHNLMFTNPNVEAVESMKKIVDIRRKP